MALVPILQDSTSNPMSSTVRDSNWSVDSGSSLRGDVDPARDEGHANRLHACTPAGLPPPPQSTPSGSSPDRCSATLRPRPSLSLRVPGLATHDPDDSGFENEGDCSSTTSPPDAPVFLLPALRPRMADPAEADEVSGSSQSSTGSYSCLVCLRLQYLFSMFVGELGTSIMPLASSPPSRPFVSLTISRRDCKLCSHFFIFAIFREHIANIFAIFLSRRYFLNRYCNISCETFLFRQKHFAFTISV